jgi:hypothetical protein
MQRLVHEEAKTRNREPQKPKFLLPPSYQVAFSIKGCSIPANIKKIIHKAAHNNTQRFKILKDTKWSTFQFNDVD